MGAAPIYSPHPFRGSRVREPTQNLQNLRPRGTPPIPPTPPHLGPKTIKKTTLEKTPQKSQNTPNHPSLLSP